MERKERFTVRRTKNSENRTVPGLDLKIVTDPELH